MGGEEGAQSDVRARLEAQLAKLQAELHILSKALDQKSKGDAAKPSYGKRVGDHTAEAIERVSKEGEARNLAKLIEEVQTALRRIDDGTYGVCRSCGQPIHPERLQFLPSAVLCVDCKRKEEHSRNRN